LRLRGRADVAGAARSLIRLEVIKKGYNPCSKTLKRHWREGKDGDLGLVYTIGRLLSDNRALTKTNPPALWFIALTN